MQSAFYQRHLEAGVVTKRSFYMPGNEYLGDYFQLWLGLFQSTVLGDMAYLNVDIQHKAFPSMYDRLTDLVQDIQRDSRTNPNLNAPLDSRVYDTLRRHLSGLDIRYMLGDKGYERKFLGLEAPPSQYKFDKDGTLVTIEAYLRTTYNYAVKYPQIPCIKMGNPNKSMVVPLELCSLNNKQVSSKLFFFSIFFIHF